MEPSRLNEQTFSLEVPPDWEVRHESGQVFLISRTPPGVLCCTAELVRQTEELPNLSRMLAGFLTRTGHPVATDELLRLTNIPNAAGFCWQYFEDGSFHRVWIFGNRRSWLLWTFSSASTDLDHFHPLLEALQKSLTLVAE